MLAQQRIELTGHEGRETLDAAIAYPHPLAVRAGKHEGAAVHAEQVESAEHLRLLATHHVRHAVVVVAQARHDRDAAQRRLCLHPGQLRGHLGEAGGAGAVGRLLPALAAADHAGHQAKSASSPDPAGAGSYQNRSKSTVRHGEDAACRGPFFQHLAVRAQPRDAKRRGTPVDGDELLHNSAFTASGRGRGATAPQPCTARAAAAFA